MSLYCMESLGEKYEEAKQNIFNNKEIAMKYIESVPDIELEYEKNFISILVEKIEESRRLFINRQDLEKSYVDKKIENLEQSNSELKVAGLLEEFDNVLSFFVANGLILVPDKDFDKLYVNEEQLKRINNHYFNDNGKSYTKGPKK